MPGEAEHVVRAVDTSADQVAPAGRLAVVAAADTSEGAEPSGVEYDAQFQCSQALHSLNRNACFQGRNFRNWRRRAWWIVTFDFSFATVQGQLYYSRMQIWMTTSALELITSKLLLSAYELARMAVAIWRESASNVDVEPR